MNYYLIDFENVRLDGIKDFYGIQECDTIIFFYSEQCKNVTFDVLDMIVKLHLQCMCFKVKVGTKNALDFQLSSYLGYLIGTNGSISNYYIVSNDKGFDCLCNYWSEQNISVQRISLQCYA